MSRQLSLFECSIPLSGVLPAVRVAMNRAAGADTEGRKRLVDKINNLAMGAGVKLTAGNTRGISKDTLDKWLSPADRDHPPSVLAVVALCLAIDDFEAIAVLARVGGLKVITADEEKILIYGKACLEEEKARKRKREARSIFDD